MFVFIGAAVKSRDAARAICVLILMSLLTACVDPTVSVRRTGGSSVRVERTANPAVTADQHRVEKGDTLYGIAFRYQLDVRELVQINQIYAPYIIYPGQMLRLKPENSSSAPVQTAEIRAIPAPEYVSNSVGTANTTAVNTQAITSTSAQPQTVGVSSAGYVSAGGSITLAPTVVPASEGFVNADPNAEVSTNTANSASSGNPTPAAAATDPATTATVSEVIAPAPVSPAPTIAAIPNAIPAAPALSGAIGAPKPGANGWAWPTEGRLLSTFAASDAGRQGIDIRGNLGQPVYAAKGGTVVYSGRGIRGYGELIVIKHDESTLSAYGHNQTRSAKEGQVVKQGALIAEMGKDPQGKELLHFEVRKNGKPVDPLGVLPRK